MDKNLNELFKSELNILHTCSDFGFTTDGKNIQKIFRIFKYGSNKGVNLVLIPEDGYEDFITESFEFLQNIISIKEIELIEEVQIKIFPDIDFTRFKIDKKSIQIKLEMDQWNPLYLFENFWNWKVYDPNNNIIGYSKTKHLFYK